MNIRDRIGAVFAFNTAPTTILLLLVYAAIFTSVLVTDNLPSIPTNTRGLDLDQAWWDLHRVSARPHPFNSHANDLVRDFVLHRVRDVASRHRLIEVDYDTVSNASWATGRAVYQEGNNILVRVLGTDPTYHESGGYLLSAHYDSVSTAPGTTDDSMGIITLLQMLEYFAKHRPKRTVVFNFNNNEESGLNGAHTFLQHPWANISDVFLNLEGAAAGGRPVMFRATNVPSLLSWTRNHVPHPHASVIFADAMSHGLGVRSATDYSVYEKAGLDGLDFAFYRGRSRYHTPYDSISGMEGSRKALWAMMEATHGASLALANDDVVHAQPLARQERPVYFELFGAALVVFSLETLFISNVVLLSTGPIILLLLAFSKHIVRLSKRIRLRYSANLNENGTHQDITYGERTLVALKKFGATCWISTKFWVALVVGIGLQAALIAGYVKLNPFVLHSHPSLVFASTSSLAYLSTVLVISFPCSSRNALVAPEQQKLSIILQLYGFTWLLLVLSTVLMRSAEIGSTYLITIWNICTLLGCIVGLVEAMTNAPGFEADPPQTQTYVGHVQYQAIGTEDADGQQPSTRIVEDSEPTETTPLVPREHLQSSAPPPEEGKGAIGWWIVQLLLVVPFPVILVFHIAITVLWGISQTLTDGNSPASTYAIVSLLALLLILPISPFSINIHRWLTLLVLAIFVLSTVYAWTAFPFSQEAPLKLYFSQTVDLAAHGTGIERVTTALTAPREYLASHIIPELPSAYGKPVRCADDARKAGLQVCAWDVKPEMAPSPGGRNNSANDAAAQRPWVSYHVERTGQTSARVVVQGLNTRFCTITFTNRGISAFSVAGDGGKGLQRGYEIRPQGIREIELWSRDFGKQFEVVVEWEDRGDGSESEDEGVQGRVSCGWDEHESGTVGGGRSGGKIPSLEEVKQFLPEWAVATKWTSALFSAGREFSV